MKNNYIEDVFSDYLKTEKTNYALLINGTWGSGKTYYWKNILAKLAEEAKLTPIYLSLNGISKIETLDYQLKIKLIPFLNKLDIKNSASIGKLSKNALFQWVKGKWGIDAEELIKDVDIDLTLFSKNVLCFDDLERCKIPLSEVLGYVNNFVEHKNSKVIFLSDESKILDKDENYNSIKEKVVGRILNFKNNLSDSFPLLFEKYIDTNPEFYAFLKEKKEFIYSLLTEYKQENLRNIAFYLESLNKIYPFIKNHANYSDEVLLFTLIITLEFKTGNLTSNDFEDFKGYDDINSAFSLFNFSQLLNDNHSNNEAKKEEPKSELELFHEKYLQNNISIYCFYPSIYQYILTGYLDTDKLSNELTSRYPIEIPKETTAFRKLLNYNFRHLPNDEFTELFSEVLEHSKNGKYSIYDYLQISNFFNYFSNNKLINLSLQEIQEVLSNGINIAKLREESDKRLYDSIFHFGTKDYDQVIVELIKEAHKSIIAKKEKIKVNKLIIALSEDNSELVTDIFSEYQVRKELFELLKPDELFNALQSIKNETLSEFNLLLSDRYKSVNIKDFLSSDLAFLEELNSLIVRKLNNKKSFQVQDLLFKELSHTIDEICKKLR
ncbi:P-loop NTPase fold protein [Moheibacter sediminis]|uniref:KAP NTPase domain-containing protein n=1 Tax=Moheibacter sediminis TaxID=1434700 RepID=A0A1W2B5Z2_9FLAO|nr:P-loop NTPase fold protein [Moheibacter sediminis]SMC68181.1 hypothetical protein SAMN06296427_105289 [Moheibacter sediminis]